MGITPKSSPAQGTASASAAGTATAKTSKPKSKAEKDSVAAAKRKATGGTGLNDLFIVIFGLGFLLSASMNILHSFEKIPHAQHDTAIGAAVADFKSIAKPRKNKQKIIDDMKSRHEQLQNKKVYPPAHPDDHTHDNPQRGHEDNLDHAELNVGGDQLPAEIHNQGDPVLSHLSCDKYGGPSPEIASEMVYWSDIPSDANYMSPFHNGNKHESDRKYMTFEPDGGGWNNIRMAMESVIGLAVAMGRTLVMPPQKKM